MIRRAYKATSRYPAFNHTSYNVEFGTNRTNLHLSIHLRYAWGGGGFWFGLRPEIELTRNEDRIIALRKQLRASRVLHKCAKCGTEKWGARGMGRPENWGYVHLLDFCEECITNFTYQELFSSRD